RARPVVSEGRIRRRVGALPARSCHPAPRARRRRDARARVRAAGFRSIHGLIKRSAPPQGGRRPEPAPVPAEAHPRAPSAAPRQCLIVDDSRVVRQLSRRIVASLGFTVTEAEDGKEALARCEAGMPDLILLDWNMPQMTGIEFITALRARPAGGTPK